MAELALDTSGSVFVPYTPGLRRFGDLAWTDLQPLVQGNLEELFARLDRDFMGEPRFEVEPVEGVARMFVSVGYSALAPDTIIRLTEDCERYQAAFSIPPTVENGRLMWGLRQGGSSSILPPLTVHFDGRRVHLREAAHG